jgi:hypothetical protein
VVVATTGGACNALQPDPGYVKNDGRASVPRVTVQMPSLVAAAAARFPSLVPSHFVGQGSGFTTGGVSDTTQPATMLAAARNLDSELRCADCGLAKRGTKGRNEDLRLDQRDRVVNITVKGKRLACVAMAICIQQARG